MRTEWQAVFACRMNFLSVCTLLCTLCCCTLAQYCATNSYYSTRVNHTMCIYKDKACTGSQLSRSGGLTATHKKEIVDLHNSLRKMLLNRQVPGQPAAASMKTMVWNEELATIAQRYADQCVFAHDQERRIKEYSVGQNIYMSQQSPIPSTEPDFTAGIMKWWNEYKLFSPSNIKPFLFSMATGHYTQVAWANTSDIGCGYAMFIKVANWANKIYVCNYGAAGNMRGGEMYVVTKR